MPNSVFLDGDWCWDADPFQVTEETKAMVMRNICFLLNSFLHCTAYENIIFCWVMYEQSIIDEIIDRLDTGDARVIKISLMIDETNLRKRLSADIARGIRSNDVIDRSKVWIDMYQTLDTIKVDTVNKNVYEIVSEILTFDINKFQFMENQQIASYLSIFDSGPGASQFLFFKNKLQTGLHHGFRLRRS